MTLRRIVVVVGASGAGKSQLLLRYTQDRFNESSKATIGVDFGHKSITFDGKVVRAQVRSFSPLFVHPNILPNAVDWRIFRSRIFSFFYLQIPRFGTLQAKYVTSFSSNTLIFALNDVSDEEIVQERFKAIMPKFYAGTHGALIVYSIVDRNSFEAVGDWLEEIKRQTDCRFVMLVGNKSDLEVSRAVTRAEGQEFASKNDLLFMETSAKISTNVDEAFSAVIKDIFDDTINPVNKKLDDPDDFHPSPSGPTVVLKPEVINDPQPARRGCPC